MTVELSAYAPEDVQTALVAWLTTVHHAAFARNAGDPLPSIVVEHITGTESAQMGVADQLASVHTFCDKALGYPAARDNCAGTHKRMLLLATTSQTITISGRQVGVDYVEVVESPHWEYYSDNILRKVGRYRIGLPYSTA